MSCTKVALHEEEKKKVYLLGFGATSSPGCWLSLAGQDAFVPGYMVHGTAVVNCCAESHFPHNCGNSLSVLC